MYRLIDRWIGLDVRARAIRSLPWASNATARGPRFDADRSYRELPPAVLSILPRRRETKGPCMHQDRQPRIGARGGLFPSPPLFDRPAWIIFLFS